MATCVRILHTLCRIHSGGVEQRRVLLAQGLGSDRYEHALICQEADGPIPDILRNFGWSIHEIGLAPGILNPAWHARAYQIARSFKPDIVHGAVYEGEALACSIGLRMPSVKVIMEETSDPVNRRWTGNALMQAMCMRADVCVGVSPKVSGYLRDRLKIPERKIRTVNNAVPEAETPPAERLQEMRATLGVRPGDLIIGSVGRVYDGHKRFSDLIQALPAVRERHPTARLLIVGDGPDRAMLTELAQSMKVEPDVIFAGYQGNARDFYHVMDVFALASAHEAFGLVLVEAMLAGVPIVATAVGGIPFVLDGGRAGRLVPPLDPSTLSAAIVDLLDNPSERARLAAEGLSRARSEFSASRYVAEIDQLYRTLKNC
ncbi:glycosyltransferase (plasmid) [Cereibacter azotoformans]|uniref:glycosyltransferase n=1 Tax=Cereibacter azotoformans TaxID=43057 RepID=UPI003B21A707